MSEEKQVLTLRIPKDLHQELRTFAFTEKQSLNSIGVKALSDWAKKNKKSK